MYAFRRIHNAGSRIHPASSHLPMSPSIVARRKIARQLLLTANTRKSLNSKLAAAPFEAARLVGSRVGAARRSKFLMRSLPYLRLKIRGRQGLAPSAIEPIRQRELLNLEAESEVKVSSRPEGMMGKTIASFFKRTTHNEIAQKIPAFLDTPAGMVITLGVLILGTEFLIMSAGGMITGILNVEHALLDIIDPILLTLGILPALYLLIFRPVCERQARLEQQLDELRRFQNLTIGRELRMKELAEENAALRRSLSVEPAADIHVTGSSQEAPCDASEQYPSIQPTEESQRGALLFMLEDLEVGRKKIEQAHQEWIAALDAVHDPIFLHDKDFRILRCNKAYQQCAGISFHEIIGQPYYEVFPKIGAPLPCCLRAMEAEEEVASGAAIYRSRASSIHDEQGVYLYSVHTFEDVTERKHAAEELRLRAQLLDSASDTIFVLDFNGNFIYLNEAAWKTRGYTRDEMMAMNLHVLDTPKYEKLIESRMRELRENGRCIFESEHRRKDGSIMPVEINARIIESGGRKLVLSVIRDITERKATETAIQHANRALATLSAVNSSLVHITDENELLQAVCNAIVEQRGYRLAWVGYKQHDESKSIKIMAHASGGGGYPDTIQPTWAEEASGMGPSGRAVRSGTTQLCQDIANDPHYSPWRDEALKRGYAASIALPLLNGDNTVFGVLAVYAGEVNAFTPAEITLLEEMAGDMAFGVHTLHTRHERDLAQDKVQQQLVQLQDSLEDTVQAIATIVEMRDPYTAGHQARVADLAAAIARQMGLPDEQVHAIHLAGIVHDLGKIRIPAEILSKPGRITDLEFELIKVHPQAGYDILKGISFPWPIALMVLQHHERLDDSGYPQGLKGDAILLEARILSVADVVEAMSSHRPYRPGLGIEVAMEEITKNRGKFYDPQVVDACLTVFREQGYSFKG